MVSHAIAWPPHCPFSIARPRGEVKRGMGEKAAREILLRPQDGIFPVFVLYCIRFEPLIS